MRRSLAFALPALLVVAGAVPARAQETQTECPIPMSSLPEATEGVAYDAPAFQSTAPGSGISASNLPPGLALSGSHIKGTPTVPGSYSVGLTYVSACGKPLKQKQTEIDAGPPTSYQHIVLPLKVRDTHAPVIGSFTVTPSALGSAGGSVTLTLKATDNVGVTRVMMTTKHPDGHSGSAFVPLTGGTAANGTWSISFSLGGNTAATAATYAFTISASDLDGNTARGGPSNVVLSASGAQPPQIIPIRR